MKPYIDMLPEFEGRTNYAYKDAGGVLTCGVGHSFALSEALDLFPDATVGDLTAMRNWVGVHPAAYYEWLTECRLTDTLIDVLLNEDLDAAEHEIGEAWSAYDGLPVGPRDAVLDCVFNLGCNGWMHKFPKMRAALEAGDWRAAAAECERNGIQQERNNWTRQAILSALPDSSPIIPSL